MECEKFDPLLLDELYEELDELTSAAVKRHVAGCSRCASMLGDLNATRRAVTLPLVPVPEGLEERILAAAREAQKVAPMRGRLSRALSIAGSWAMRPQTAMAAVFLLMIGTSAVLIRSKNYASHESAVSVTVAGAPAPTAAPAGYGEALDDKVAASAHGPTPPIVTRAPASSAKSLAEPESEQAQANAVLAALDDVGDEAMAGAGYTDERAKTRAAASPALLPPAATAAGRSDDVDGVTPSSPAKAGAAARSGHGEQAQDPFSLGTAAFRARNFAEATRQFDAAAQSGDTNAALWAAESTREGQGCAVALGRFVQLSQRAAGSWVGNEASLRAARCQAAMGQIATARERLDKLVHVPSHQQAARSALDELDQVATRKAAGAGNASGGAVASPKRTAAPAARPAAPSPAPAEAQEQKKATDRAVGF